MAFGDFVENKAGNIYIENGSLVQREEHSFGMGEVAISTFARASIWGIRIMAIISDFQSDDVGSIPIYPSIRERSSEVEHRPFKAGVGIS